MFPTFKSQMSCTGFTIAARIAAPVTHHATSHINGLKHTFTLDIFKNLKLAFNKNGNGAIMSATSANLS